MADELITERNLTSIPVSVFVRFVLTESSIMGGATPFTTNGRKLTIRAPSGDDDGFSQNQDQEPHEFTFSHVFEENVDEKQFFNQVVDPLLSEFVNGIHSNLFLSGSDECQLDDICANSFMSPFSEVLFSKLNGKSDNSSSYRMRVCSYRIFNESIGDLFHQMNSSKEQQQVSRLSFRNDELKGVRVSPFITWLEVKDPEHLVKLYHMSSTQRNQEFHQRWSFKISTRSVYVFEVDLQQVVNSESGDGSNSQQKLHSNFKIIEFNGVERLCTGNETLLKTREGELINEYLMSFNILIKTLISSPLTEFVSYYRSCLTQLLRDVYGGNALTSVILFANRQEKKIELYSRIFELFSSLRMIKNFPVMNDDLALGVLARIRSEANYLVGRGPGNIRGTGNDSATDQRMLKMNLELLRITERKTSIEREYANLKGQNIELTRKHQRLKDTFKKSEIERVHYFEMLSKIESLLGSGTLGKGSDNLETILKRLSSEKEEKKHVMLEYVALKKTFSKMKGQSLELQLKNDKLNIELLKLIKLNLSQNRRRKAVEKDEFVRQLGKMKKENEAVEREHSRALLEIQSLKNSSEKLQIQLETSKIENERIRLSKKSTKKDEEIIALKMQFRKQQFETNQHRVLVEQLKKQEIERAEETKNLQLHIERLEEDHRTKLRTYIVKFEELSESTRVQRENATERNERREEEERTLLDQEKKKQQQNMDPNNEGRKSSASSARLKRREMDLRFLAELRKEETELTKLATGVREEVQKMTNDLVDTYAVKETRQVGETEKLREKCSNLSQQRNFLLEKYVELKLTFLSRIESDESVFDSLLIRDEELEDLRLASTRHRENQTAELYETQQQLESSEKMVNRLKRQHLKATQDHEGVSMNIQKKYMTLLQDYTSLQSDLVRTKKRGRAAKVDEDALSKHLENMQNKMMEEVNSMKQMQSSDQSNSESLKVQITELESSLEEKNRLIETLRTEKDVIEDRNQQAIVSDKKGRAQIKHLEKHYRILKKEFRTMEERARSVQKLQKECSELKMHIEQLEKENELLKQVVKNKGSDNDSEIMNRYLIMKTDLTAQLNKYKTQCRLNEEQLKMMQKIVTEKKRRQVFRRKKPRRESSGNNNNNSPSPRNPIPRQPSRNRENHVDRIVLDPHRPFSGGGDGRVSSSRQSIGRRSGRSGNSNNNNNLGSEIDGGGGGVSTGRRSGRSLGRRSNLQRGEDIMDDPNRLPRID